jgi:hypothetical protein
VVLCGAEVVTMLPPQAAHIASPSTRPRQAMDLRTAESMRSGYVGLRSVAPARVVRNGDVGDREPGSRAIVGGDGVVVTGCGFQPLTHSG